MYTTKEVIKMLENNKLGLVFHMTTEMHTHIFKTVSDEICIGKYGNGEIRNIKDCKEYLKVRWIK